MTVIKSDEAEKNALLLAAQLMAVSVRTAPKTRGIDHIVTLIVTGDEKERLAQTPVHFPSAKEFLQIAPHRIRTFD